MPLHTCRSCGRVRGLFHGRSRCNCACGHFFSLHQNHIIMIRHHDLAKLSTKELQAELLYLDGHANEINKAIQGRIAQMMLGIQYAVSIPIWKLHEDYSACTDRMQAIVEEIEFRKTP